MTCNPYNMLSIISDSSVSVWLHMRRKRCISETNGYRCRQRNQTDRFRQGFRKTSHSMTFSLTRRCSQKHSTPSSDCLESKSNQDMRCTCTWFTHVQQCWKWRQSHIYIPAIGFDRHHIFFVQISFCDSTCIVSGMTSHRNDNGTICYHLCSVQTSF